MRTLLSNLVTAGFCGVFLITSPSGLSQGALAPPGAPAPMMKTLAQIEPRTPISSAPFTIAQPGSYCLTTNLLGVNGTNGIVISSGDVTLDLNGFALLGVPGSLEGIILAAGVTNVAIKNGTVRSWGGSGISCSSGRNVTVQDVMLSDNGVYGVFLGGAVNSVIRDCVSRNNQQFGFYAVEGVIAHCSAEGNNSEGIYMLYGLISDCNATLNGGNGIFGFDTNVRNCTANFNARGTRTLPLAGIRADEGSLVSGCVANYNGNSTNGAGIFSDSTGATSTNFVVENCTVTGNQNDGIQAIGPATIVNNTANDNGKGFLLSAGIHTVGSGSFIEGNRVRGNNRYGILSSGGTNADVIIRNAAGNNLTNYFPSSGTNFAPIQNPATMTNSWGNIVF